MIKKIILSLLFVNFVFADNFTLDQLRTNQVIELESNLDDISKKTENYIISTADINVDKQKLINKFSLPTNYFNNLEGNQLNYTFDNVKKTIHISNLFGSSGNEFIQSNLLSNSTISKVFSSNNNYDVTYYLSPTTSNFVSLVQKINLNPNIVLSLTQPSDTTKTWYQPLGNGSFKVSNFISSWTQSGTSDPMNSAAIQVSSIDLLNKIACIINDQGFVNDGTKADIYVCTNNNTWVKINMGSTSMYNGDTNILALLTTLLDSPGGSIGNVEDPNQTGVKNLFSGFKKFTKRDSSFGSLKGYWLDDTKTFVVAETLSDLSTKIWANGVYAYILNNAKNNVVLLQRINNSWMTISDGYNGVILSEITNLLSYDKKNNKYFKYTSDYWYEVNSSGVNLNTMYLTSNSNGRSIFPAPSSSTVKYLTLNNDCLSTTCYGLSGTQYFAGEKLDSMYVYYYSTSGKRENNLIDAIPATSITDIYNRSLYAGLVGNIVYLRDLDTLGRTCYTKPSDNTWWTKAGVSIPTGNNLPTSINCETASYSGTNLILNTKTDATDWTTAPNLAGVYITASSSNYEHKLSGSLDFWTNNGSGYGQENATEIFTGGNRTSFPTVSHTINALTKLVDTPNYTGTGVTSTIDSSFKQWHYASGLGVKNLIDVPIVTSYIDMYDKNYPKTMYNGVIYNKGLDTLSRTCYQNTSTNQYWTKTGYLIQTGNNLPSSVTCSTATYSGTNLNLGTRTDATNWITAPDGAGVYLTSISTNYSHKLGGSLDFWTNNINIDGQSSATEIFTRGTRVNFPNVTHTINALTKLVDTPNYTSTGVTSTIDSSFKSWFYSLSGTTVNSMLDAVIPIATYATSNGNGSFGYTAGTTKNAYLDTTAKTVGYAYLNGLVARYDGTYWKPITNSTKVLSGDFTRQFNVTDIGGVSGNGLVYTGTSAPFNATYSPESQFGVTTWSVVNMNSINPRGNNTNICESRGMLLPLLSETAGTSNPWGGYVPSGGSMGTASGVPSHPSGYTWTSSSNTYDIVYYWIWYGSSTDGGYYNYDSYVRCVR